MAHGDGDIRLRVGSGGHRNLPPMILRCCHCRRPTGKKQMVEETNPNSPVYGQWSCRRRGCLETIAALRTDHAYQMSNLTIEPEDFSPEKNRWL